MLGTGTLSSSGVATFTTTNLPASGSLGGSLRLYAAYPGDSTFASSQSNPPILYQMVFLPLIITCQTNNTGTVGEPFDSGPMDVTGGDAPYTFSVGSGMLPPGLTLNTSNGDVSGTPTAPGTFTIIVTDAVGNVGRGCSITIGQQTCGSSLTPITYNVNEKNTIGEIAWFNSHLSKLRGTIPTSNFQIFITGGQITFGSSQLNVPNAVITFSSTATCSSTKFDTTLGIWETTLPLSAASQADEIFAAGLAYLIPTGFPQNVNNVTWSANVSSSAPGLQVTWQYGVSNWLTSNNGTSFPVVTASPFVPDYNSMMVLAAHNAPNCYGGAGDHAGAPEFGGRQNVLTGGGSGGGGSNWTGSWSSTPPAVQACNP